MPLNTDLNTTPYFDDFDANNQYYRILFRPATAIQARELTQVQSTLQNQIESFGNWAFRNGDIVSGCSISDVPILPYIRLADFASNSVGIATSIGGYDIANLVGTQAVSNSGLNARVLFAAPGLSTNYPNTMVIYVQYLGTGSNATTNNITSFSNNEPLTFYKVPQTGNATADTVAVIRTYANSVANQTTCGNAHGISVSEGVVFLNGNFVKVLTPTFGVVNNFGTNAGNNVIGFQGVESIITENQDPTLADNALGYSNENAPGAHRLKIVPTLVSFDPANTIQANTYANNFNPIATYNTGNMVTKSFASSNLYSIVGDAIAKRVYEESGNYVVNPFAVDSVSDRGDGSTPSLGANGVFGRINPGIGYAQGQRVELLNTYYIDMRRGVDTQVNKEQTITFNYGSYLILNEVAGSPDFTQAQTVTLYDVAQKAITNRTFSSLSPAGNAIGTASVRCFSYKNGTVGSNTAQYTLHLFNIKMNAGYNTNKINSIYYNGAKKAVGDVVSTGLIGTSSKNQLYSFGVKGLKNLRDSSNTNNTQYTYRTKYSNTMNTSGQVTFTLTNGDQLPYGAGVLSDLNAATFNLIVTSNTSTIDLGGGVNTVNVYNTNTAVRGTSGTNFVTQFSLGDQILVGADVRTVTSITNSTFMSVDAAFSANSSGNQYKKTFLAGKILPIIQSTSGTSGYVNVTNSTSFTIVSGYAPATNMPVDVIFDAEKKQVVPAKKDIKKDRFVKINTSTNPSGPWCLGFSDIHQVKKIYGGPSGYSANGADITSQFVFDTGQKDTHYDLGYIYPKSSYTSTTNPYLVVQLDYFAVNTAPGIGFFTIESYPIDDANTANNTAIQTKDIPLYVDEAGNKIALKDYVDFRTSANNQATDTGNLSYDANNVPTSASITAAVAAASINPANTLQFITGSGLNVPSYGQNFQADYTVYLPRKDLIYITPDNIVKVKEGLSSLSPQTPLYPENSMAVAVLNVPPYPSLSSDQTDNMMNINKLSKNLVRDTSSSINCTIVTNRRYSMKDIGKLDQRITNLEYYTALSLLEKKASDLKVTDAYGLDRFKNGIFVDPFSSFELSDVTDAEYTIAIDSAKGVARPRITREVVKIQFANNATTQQTGRAVTLPYTEQAFLVQPYATKYRSAALVAFAWNGTLYLFPSFDNHGDTVNTGSLNITIDNSTPWKDFANSPFGSVWGDWRTTSTSQSNTVVGQTRRVAVDLGTNIGVHSEAALRENVWTYLQRAGYSPNDVTVGNISLEFRG
jgi:hypothetical protein